MKKLMILGAGIYQVPLIKKAKEMGIETIVMSIDGNYPGFAFADHVYKIDTRDCDGILATAIYENIDGILTTGTDVAVRTIGFVASAMGLPGISSEAARILTDKADMKVAFGRGVTTSPFRIVRNVHDACIAADELGYPVMMKACDFSGSRGISRADNKEELEKAFALSQSVSHVHHYIVEQVTEGQEIGLDAFVYHGEIRLCLPHTKYVYHAGNTTVPIGHGFPYQARDGVNDTIRQELEAIVKTTGMDNCAVNADLFVQPDGNVSIIEAGGRAGATCIPELIFEYTGIDYYRQLILCAIGEVPDFTITRHTPCIGMLISSPKNGIIGEIDTQKIEALSSGDVSVSLDYKIGDRVFAMRNGTDRIGQVIMRTDQPKEVKRKIREVLSCIKINEGA